jgi:DNA polymerase III subunit alpha
VNTSAQPEASSTPGGAAGFCHLHVHSDYSALDGACKVQDIVEKAAACGMPAVAITDHGVLSGAVQFYQKATEAGVKPLIGLEAYVVADRRSKDAQSEERWHLTLLARNNEGYGNLIKLASRAFLEGYYTKPRIDYDLLREHAAGLICLSGCPTGRLSKCLERGSQKEAHREIERLSDIFGIDNLYIEIQETGIADLAHVPPLLAEISAETGVPLVATNDVHYMEAEDAVSHDVLLCIQTGSRLEDTKRLRFSSEEFYFKTAAEMREAFKKYPEAVDNTVKVAERCSVNMEFGQIRLPSYPVAGGSDEMGYLRERCEQGLERRYGTEPSPEVRERLAMELAVIEEMGFASYFLIVWDFVAYAKR